MANEFVRNRSVALDCIRCLAIVLVLLFHVASRYSPNLLDPVALFFLRVGFFGVDIFYPLSGFLISRFLLTHVEAGTIRTFFLRRAFRILPLYFVAITAYLAASLALNHEPEIVDRIWVNYLFLTGWFIFFDGGPDLVPYTITWSLSVEEFSYIILGVTAWVMRRHFVAMLIFLSVGAIVLRFGIVMVAPERINEIYYFPPARLDSIAIGGLAAVGILRERRAGMTAGIFAVAALITGVLCFVNPVLAKTFIYVSITCATCALISASETVLPPVNSAVATGAARVGFYSYFIYLFHFFNIDGLILFQEKMFPDLYISFWGLSAFAMALTLLQAVISFRLFEGPLMRYGRKLEKPAAYSDRKIAGEA